MCTSKNCAFCHSGICLMTHQACGFLNSRQACTMGVHKVHRKPESLKASKAYHSRTPDYNSWASKKEIYKQCGRKERYSTLKFAQSVQRYCEAHGRGKLRVYLCPFCNGYHLTHKV